MRDSGKSMLRTMERDVLRWLEIEERGASSAKTRHVEGENGPSTKKSIMQKKTSKEGKLVLNVDILKIK